MFKTFIAALSMFVASTSFAFTVDTNQSPGPVSGHWWNASESGWGIAVQQQYETVFLQLYTYDKEGAPIWYVASCKVESGNVCSASLYTAKGGVPLPYYKPATVVPAGYVTLTFLSNDAATFSFKIGDNAAWTKDVTRLIFDDSK